MRDRDLGRLLAAASRALAAGARALETDSGSPADRPNDERLFALERTHAEYQAKLDPLFEKHGTATEAMESLLHQQLSVLEAMQTIPADTLAGAAAKARVTSIHRTDFLRGEDAPSDLQADALEALIEAYAETSPDRGVAGASSPARSGS